MKLSITVKPNSKKQSVENVGDNAYKVCVNASPQDGKANEAVIEALSVYLKIPKSRIAIIRGHKSKQKIVQLLA